MAVLVTGVSRPLGARVADALRAGPGAEHVVGIDHAATADGDGTSGDRYAEIIAGAGVDTVVHLDRIHLDDAGGRVAMRETNVVATMRLLAACQRSLTVERIVLGSTTAVYGASPSDPAVFTERTPPRGRPPGVYARDAAEIEGYARDLGGRRGDITITVLRMAEIVGGGLTSPLTRYLATPVVPVPLGRDPRLQFLHIDDAVAVLRRTAVADHPGVFNVAGRGTVPLSGALRRSGRALLRLPEPGLRAFCGLAARAGLGGPPRDERELLRYGRVVDTSAIERELGWSPRYGSAAAFDAAFGAMPARAPA